MTKQRSEALDGLVSKLESFKIDLNGYYGTSECNRSFLQTAPK
jgi:hypothetical protein